MLPSSLVVEKETTQDPLLKRISKVIKETVEVHMDTDEEASKEEVVKKALELYMESRDSVAPTICDFADHVLKGTGEGTKLLFLARDALGVYEASTILLDRFPQKYREIPQESLVYVYLNRKVMFNSDPQDIFRYLKQEGLGQGDQVNIVDIGMYGTIINPLKKILSLRDIGVTNVKFLISRSDVAEGFIDDGRDKQMKAFPRISGNLAVHFMEDTFSGYVKSPSKLVRTQNPTALQPDTIDQKYGFPEILYRHVAIQAIKDYAAAVEYREVGNISEHIEKLDTLLCDANRLKRIMIQHEN